MSGIFGGSKSRSRNTNKDVINSAFAPLMGQAATANNQISALLGGDASGFNRFKDATGFDFELMRGMDNVGSSFSGRNVFRSGARDKAIAEFGAGINNRFAQQYIQALLGQSGQALGAGQLVAGAGQESTSTSSPGLGSLIGGVLSGAAALKTGGASLKAGLGKGG